MHATPPTPFRPPSVLDREYRSVSLHAQTSLYGLSPGFTSPDLTPLGPPHPPGRGGGCVECVRKAQAPVRPPPGTSAPPSAPPSPHTKVGYSRAQFNSFKPFFQCVQAVWPSGTGVTREPGQKCCRGRTRTKHHKSKHTAAASAGLHGTGRCVHTAART